MPNLSDQTIRLLLDTSGAEAGAAQIEQRLKRLQATAALTGRSLNNSFSGVERRLLGSSVSASRVEAAVGRIDAAARRSAAGVDRLGNEFRQANIAARGLEVSTRRAANSLQRLGGSAATSSLGGLNTLFLAAGTSAAFFGRAVLDTAVRMQDLQTRLQTVFGSASQAEQTFSRLGDLANRFGFTILETGESFSQFALISSQAGVTLEQAEKVFENVTIAARAAGVSSYRLNLAFVALQQIAAKGTVSMEEFRRQLQEAVPTVAQVAIDNLGISMGELFERIRSGDVSSREFFTALSGSNRFTEAADRQAQNLGASINRLQSAFQELADATATNLNPALQTMLNLLQSITRGLTGDVGQAIGALALLIPGGLALRGAFTGARVAAQYSRATGIGARERLSQFREGYIAARQATGFNRARPRGGLAAAEDASDELRRTIGIDSFDLPRRIPGAGRLLAGAGGVLGGGTIGGSILARAINENTRATESNTQSLRGAANIRRAARRGEITRPPTLEEQLGFGPPTDDTGRGTGRANIARRTQENRRLRQDFEQLFTDPRGFIGVQPSRQTAAGISNVEDLFDFNIPQRVQTQTLSSRINEIARFGFVQVERERERRQLEGLNLRLLRRDRAELDRDIAASPTGQINTIRERIQLQTRINVLQTRDLGLINDQISELETRNEVDLTYLRQIQQRPNLLRQELEIEREQLRLQVQRQQLRLSDPEYRRRITRSELLDQQAQQLIDTGELSAEQVRLRAGLAGTTSEAIVAGITEGLDSARAIWRNYFLTEVTSGLADAIFQGLLQGQTLRTASASFFSSIGNFFTLGGGRQFGGPVGAGIGYVVGEAGPELFVPNTNGRVLSNSESTRAVRGRGNQGNTFYINVNPGATFDQQVLDTLARNPNVVVNIATEGMTNNRTFQRYR